MSHGHSGLENKVPSPKSQPKAKNQHLQHCYNHRAEVTSPPWNRRHIRSDINWQKVASITSDHNGQAHSKESSNIAEQLNMAKTLAHLWVVSHISSSLIPIESHTSQWRSAYRGDLPPLIITWNSNGTAYFNDIFEAPPTPTTKDHSGAVYCKLRDLMVCH